jgi:AhpC/TSA family/Thiol:disulfide interchange protein DsbD, N-terminal
VQLQQHLPEFEAAGVELFAISYDPIEEQRKFADEFGITFPLLADPDHRVIEATGILNTLVRPDEPVYGIPFPGTYIVGTDGRVEEKLFFQHYRTRPSASTVLREGLGIDFEVENHPRADVAGDGVSIEAIFGAEGMVFMETSMLYVDLAIDDGLHVYGQPIPEGYIPTEVTVTAPEGVEVGEPQYPPTTPFRVEGINADFQVFEQNARIKVMVQRLSPDIESIPLDVTVRYQACNDRECFLPQTKTLHLDVPAEALNRPQRRD